MNVFEEIGQINGVFHHVQFILAASAQEAWESVAYGNWPVLRDRAYLVQAKSDALAAVNHTTSTLVALDAWTSGA